MRVHRGWDEDDRDLSPKLHGRPEIIVLRRTAPSGWQKSQPGEPQAAETVYRQSP